MAMKRFYILMMIVGTLVPWLFFGQFFSENGINIFLFIKSLFVNGAAGGFTADIIISIFVFWIWSFVDARKNNVQNWWLILPTSCFVGLSLSLPLYLFLKLKTQEE